MAVLFLPLQNCYGAGNMAVWPRAQASLLEDLGSVPSTMQLTSICNPSSRGLDVLIWSLTGTKSRHTIHIHSYTRQNTMHVKNKLHALCLLPQHPFNLFSPSDIKWNMFSWRLNGTSNIQILLLSPNQETISFCNQHLCWMIKTWLLVIFFSWLLCHSLSLFKGKYMFLINYLFFPTLSHGHLSPFPP